MALRFIMIGDIVGKPGRRAVQQLLPTLRERYAPHLIIANGENIAGGSGITPQLYQRLLAYGLDGITLGDHCYRQKAIMPAFEKHEIDRMIRPANLPEQAVGPRWMKLPHPEGGRGLYVVIVLGRLFMTNLLGDDPYAAVEGFLSEIEAEEDNPQVLVEIHAEATSEKCAMGHYLDGRVAAVVGSHTHIPTADAKILPGGTAYITDVGMTGPYDSVLGRRKDRVLQFMTTAVPTPFDVASEDVRLCGVLVELDDAGRATRCERIEFAADPDRPPFTQ